MRVSYLCIARKWCVRRGVIAIRVLASVCRASLCSAAEPYSGTPSDRTLKPARRQGLRHHQPHVALIRISEPAAATAHAGAADHSGQLCNPTRLVVCTQ